MNGRRVLAQTSALEQADRRQCEQQHKQVSAGHELVADQGKQIGHGQAGQQSADDAGDHHDECRIRSHGEANNDDGDT